MNFQGALHSACACRCYGDYARIWSGYAARGGLSRLHDLLHCPGSPRDPKSIARLHARIQVCEVIVFPLKHELWMPNFQFRGDCLDPVAGVRAAIGELKYFLDPVEIALWFCTPSTWLLDASPMERIRADPDSVCVAARGDRYIANG